MAVMPEIHSRVRDAYMIQSLTGHPLTARSAQPLLIRDPNFADTPPLKGSINALWRAVQYKMQNTKQITKYRKSMQFSAHLKQINASDNK